MTQAEELKRQKQVQRKELERLSGLTVTQAKQMLIADVEQDARRQAGRVLLEIDEETKRDADRRARNILSIAMGRLAGTPRERDHDPPDRASQRGDEGPDHRPRGPQHPRHRGADRCRPDHRRDPERGRRLELRRGSPRDRQADARAPDRRRPDPAGDDRGGLREGEGRGRGDDGRRGRAGRARGGRPRHRPRAARGARATAVPDLLRAERSRPPGRGVEDRRLDRRRARRLRRDRETGDAAARRRQGGQPRGRGLPRPGRRLDGPPQGRERGRRPRDRGPPQRGGRRRRSRP